MKGMKKKLWNGIRKGTVKASPAKIAEQTTTQKAEQIQVKDDLAEARELLIQAQIELLAGEENQADIDKLVIDIRNLEARAEALDRVISDLDEKYQEAMEREKQEKLKSIDEEIEALRQWGQEIRGEYVRVKTLCRAYESLLKSPLMGVGMASNEELNITRREMAMHENEVEQITRGNRSSIIARIMELKNQREQLLK